MYTYLLCCKRNNSSNPGVVFSVDNGQCAPVGIIRSVPGVQFFTGFSTVVIKLYVWIKTSVARSLTSFNNSCLGL